MFEAFKTAFAAGWGLIAAALSFVLIVGLGDTVSGIVRTVRMRQRIKRRLAD
ncbi:MAG: hypothetical protein QME75_05000 [Deltaproteobacteria bacterium]|nr:hypothetical protein [Deltaproteobacteria bacterium]